MLLAPSLSLMEPIDLEEFLVQAARVKHDILMLCLLADVWEPTACQRLADEFVKLTRNYNYTANDLALAFDTVFAAMSWKDADAKDHDDVQHTHYDILCIGGSCRHFGLMTLGKRLKLLKAAPREEMAHRELSGASEPAGVAHAPTKRRAPLRATEKTVRPLYFMGADRSPIKFSNDTSVLSTMLEVRTSFGDTAWAKANRCAKAGDAEKTVA